MRRVFGNIVSVKLIRIFTTALLLIGVGSSLFMQVVSAQQALSRSIVLGDSNPGSTTTYKAGFIITTPGALGSILVEFCDNTPLFGVACNAPAGFDISSATLVSESGETGFNIDAATTANSLLLSRSPAVTVGGPVEYVLGNVTNASASGTQYARISTYATSDASGPRSDEGGLAYSLNDPLFVNAEVPPHLTMCVAVFITGVDCNTIDGDYVNMGDFAVTRASTGQTQIVLSTNADNGYAITVAGNTMTSGSNILPALASPTVSIPGNSQFGINLRANSSPAAGQEPGGPGFGSPTSDYNQPNRFTYRNGDIIAGHDSVEDRRKYTVTYLVNISRNQSPGIYSSTFTYIGTGSF